MEAAHGGCSWRLLDIMEDARHHGGCSWRMLDIMEAAHGGC